MKATKEKERKAKENEIDACERHSWDETGWNQKGDKRRSLRGERENGWLYISKLAGAHHYWKRQPFLQT